MEFFSVSPSGPGSGKLKSASTEHKIIDTAAIKKLLFLDKKVVAIVVGTIIKIEKGFVRPPVRNSNSAN